MQKKRNEPKKRKLRLLQYRLWRYKTANAVICVFAYRQKSLSAAKDNAAHLQDIRPLRSEQSLFATRQQGGICLNDSELSRLYVEQVQMISERSLGRGVSAWLLAIDSSTHFAFCGFYHKQNGFGFGSQSALRPVSLRSKKWGKVVLIK